MQTIIFYIVLTIHGYSPFGSFPTESLIIGAVTRIYPIISYRYVTHYTYHRTLKIARKIAAAQRGADVQLLRTRGYNDYSTLQLVHC